MIDSFVFFLICLIGVSVFIQKSRERQVVAFIFAFFVLSHDAFFHSVSQNITAYYLSNGALSLLIILILSNMKSPPRLAGDIQLIALVSIMFDGVGWGLYQAGQEPIAYMVMYVFLYGWAIFTLIRGEPYGDTQTDTRFLSVRRHVHFRTLFNHTKEEEKCLTNTPQQ